jgi:serine/threonine protein kinase
VFAEDEDELAGCKAVALKLMSDPEAVEREIAQLHRAQLLDTKHVVLALRFHLASDEVGVRNLGYKSCVVFPRGDRTLSDAIVHDSFAGRLDDASAVATIRDVMLQLSAGLHHLHESCVAVHCDFKPQNAMQFGQTWKLIDFDCTALIGQPAGRKGSTLVAPPELFVFDGTHVVVRDPKSTASLPADPSYDVWSFGAVLYNLVTSHPLFLANCNDNLDPQGMWALFTWEAANCKQLLDSHIPKDSSLRVMRARELLNWILQPVPTNRPLMGEVRMHPFFQDDPQQSALPCSRLPFECFHARSDLVPATAYLTFLPEHDSHVQQLLTQLRSFCPVFAQHVHIMASHNASASFVALNSTTASASSVSIRGIHQRPLAPAIGKIKGKRRAFSCTKDFFVLTQKIDHAVYNIPIALYASATQCTKRRQWYRLHKAILEYTFYSKANVILELLLDGKTARVLSTWDLEGVKDFLEVAVSCISVPVVTDVQATDWGL